MPPKTLRELVERYRAGERKFSGSDLDGDPDGDIRGLTLDGIDLSDSFVVATFASSSLRGSSFRRANLKTCDFRGSDLRDADFSEAALDGTSFAGARLEGARFDGASIQGHLLGEDERPDW
jgi:uncharacterized protein YjbI with pentapeptide repeats